MTPQNTAEFFGEVDNSEVAQLIARALSLELSEDETIYSFCSSGSVKCTLSKSQITESLTLLESLAVFEEMSLASQNSFEMPLMEHSNTPVGRRVSDSIPEMEDAENRITYSLGRPSNEYVLFLLLKFRDPNINRYIFRPLPISFLIERMSRDSDGPILAMDVLKQAMRFKTLKISSVRPRSAASFNNFSNSYLFSLGYNLNLALVPIRQSDEILRSYRIRRVRRTNQSELVAPRKQYHPDLVYHYQLGISADIPALEYLSFYHVIEHFFEHIFNEDIVSRIRDKITSESFSYKRDRDIKDLIKMAISNRSFAEDSVNVSESEALRLTLLKFIPSPGPLADLINEYDESLLEYYANTEVPFCKGRRVDFRNLESFHKNLASRIYSTRNAIVHSKDGDRSKYTPFKDDLALLKELPVLRFIAEIIINGSAQVM
ncbi:hypothetical protein [Deinococcus aetherius]|nr:hypothetical protein [Deinococcus aetherius]